MFVSEAQTLRIMGDTRGILTAGGRPVTLALGRGGAGERRGGGGYPKRALIMWGDGDGKNLNKPPQNLEKWAQFFRGKFGFLVKAKQIVVGSGEGIL